MLLRPITINSTQKVNTGVDFSLHPHTINHLLELAPQAAGGRSCTEHIQRDFASEEVATNWLAILSILVQKIHLGVLTRSPAASGSLVFA